MIQTITWKETRYLLVPLTDDEIRARGEQLAKEIADLRDMRAEHKSQKDRRPRVAEYAPQPRPRHPSVGEVIQTRGVTEEDKVRAQMEAQTTFPIGPPA